MVHKIITFLSGYCKISVSQNFRTRIAEILLESGTNCIRSKVYNDGRYEFTVSFLSYLHLKKIFNEEDIQYSTDGVKGLPEFLLFLLKRPGLALGMVVFAVITYWTSHVIWNINVNGNNKISDEEIIIMLEELGCGYGEWIPNIDFDKLHSEFLVECEKISWISVNMKGNVANVSVREKRLGDNTNLQDGTFANVIASDDAQIISIEVHEGQSCVNLGDIVKKGDLLISGVLHFRDNEFAFEYASGEIMAYVKREISVEIPFDTTVKCYSDEKDVKKSIKIFKKSINLSPRGGIKYTTYDKIVESERLYLFDTIPLPLWYETVTYKKYGYNDVHVGYSDAVSKGMSELRYRMDEILEDSQLISNKMTTEITDNSFIVKCEMLCIKDIAEISEFSTELSTE